MKNYRLKVFITAIMVFFSYTGCDNNEDTSTEIEKNFDVTFYKVTNQSNLSSNNLQATINNEDIQFSTFGEIGIDGMPGSFYKAYAYNKANDTEAVILFDENQEPAFIYNIDLTTGEKKESVTEFVRIDSENFYMRIYHYDWTNRLGTLLFETIITKNGQDYVSNPTYEIENLDFTGSKLSLNKSKTKKTNISFKRPIKRLETYQKLRNSKTFENNMDLFDGWKESFDNLRNSDIADWLVKTKKAGAALFLTGVLVTETVVGSPAGVPLLIGGAGLVAVSTVLEVFLTDTWTNRLNIIRDRITEIRDGVVEFGNDIVQTIDNYTSDLDEWINNNIPHDNLQDLVESLEEDEIISENQNLDDLPTSEGVLQIGLSWNSANTDIDLWVTDPFGERIYFENPTSASGGFLDRDDTDGFGPENIYFQENIPSGTYRVAVHYYGCDTEPSCASTNYTIKLSDGLGWSDVYTGTLNSVDQVNNVVNLDWQ